VSRLPAAAFAVLVAATVAAFFITQHLKVSTPLIAGFPRPVPAAINPVAGVRCYDPAVGKTLNYRKMMISFYLLHASDDVDVWVVDSADRIVATLARGRFMPGGNHPIRTVFRWDGRTSDGALAPDGTYYVRVRLRHQGRTVTISDNSGPIPFRVLTTAPRPTITRVAPKVVSASQMAPIRIDYLGNETRSATVLIYRLEASRPRLVKSFVTPWHRHSAVWDGLIHRQPATPGRYLIGLKVTDLACNTGHFPARLDPPGPGASASEITVLP
jgi:hypothetical protein